MRDNFPNLECRLDLTGCDPCESFFSLNGQLIGNHHNYSFAEMKRNINHMVRIQDIQADPTAATLSRAHSKQEIVWGKQFPQDCEKADLKKYPKKGEETIEWMKGIELAQRKARSVGMVPTFFKQEIHMDDPLDMEQRWFYHPFLSDDFEREMTPDNQLPSSKENESQHLLPEEENAIDECDTWYACMVNYAW